MHWLLAVIATPLCSVAGSVEELYSRHLEQRAILEITRGFFIDRTPAMDGAADDSSIQGIAQELAGSIRRGVSTASFVAIMGSGRSTVDRIFNAAQRTNAEEFLKIATSRAEDLAANFELSARIDMSVIDVQRAAAHALPEEVGIVNNRMFQCLAVIDDFMSTHPAVDAATTSPLSPGQLEEFQDLLMDASDPRIVIETEVIPAVERNDILSALVQLKAALEREVQIDLATAELEILLLPTKAKAASERLDAILQATLRVKTMIDETQTFLARFD